MKTLYIMRHGQAEARAASDAERALTARGEQDVERVTRALASELANVEQIWVSPYRRAQQTAAIVNRVLGRGADPVTTELLTPEANLMALCDQMQQSDSMELMLVSHMPLVGELLHYLTGTDPGRYSMGTASIACVSLEVAGAGLGHLEWLHHRES